MYGILELLENLEAPNRYFQTSKPKVYHFHRERTALSPRLLRVIAPKGGTFRGDK